MGDAHVALQARLMSQALRKLSHSLSRSKTILVFVNQVWHLCNSLSNILVIQASGILMRKLSVAYSFQMHFACFSYVKENCFGILDTNLTHTSVKCTI